MISNSKKLSVYENRLKATINI